MQCKKTFSETLKFGNSMHYQAAKLYFTEESSYRAVGRELGITPLTAFRWIDKLGRNCKSFEKIAQELKPRWGGYLLADGKAVFIRGKEYALLLTADAHTQDIPIAQLAMSESKEGWESVFIPLRDRIPYPLQSLVIDGDFGLLAAIKRVFPKIPIQLCVRHVEQFLLYHFRYKYKGSGRGVDKFLEMAREILYAPDLEKWGESVKFFEAHRSTWRSCGLEAEYLSFMDKIPNIGTHFFHPGMPRTNNIIEGIIRILSRKINDTDGFESFETAWNSLKLLIMNYRFHPFSCSRIKDHNGLSPLELAGVDISNHSWVEFSQKSNVINPN